MNEFANKYNEFLLEFGKGRKMVLSSSDGGKVTSRMMSIVVVDGVLYFQTDITFRKYSQIKNNPQVALCIDNIQIEGICEECGHPMDNRAFCDVYRECFKSSFEKYTNLKNERLFSVRMTFIERWVYKDGVSFVDILDVKNQRYELNEYVGE